MLRDNLNSQNKQSSTEKLWVTVSKRWDELGERCWGKLYLEFSRFYINRINFELSTWKAEKETELEGSKKRKRELRWKHTRASRECYRSLQVHVHHFEYPIKIIKCRKCELNSGVEFCRRHHLLYNMNPVGTM